MKKLFKWLGITAGVLIVLLVVSVIALPFLIPLEKIKEFAVAKISETIHREVKIEKVSFNIFEGIKLEKLSVSNRAGFSQQPFISADALSLRYAFWPLFRREIIIKEVRLVNPHILIEKSAGGEFNFSDMTGWGSKQKSGKAEKQAFSLIIDSFSVKNAHISYFDRRANTKSELKNANLTISGITLALLKPIGLDFSAVAEYKGKNIPFSLSGKIGVDLPAATFVLSNFSLGVAGEKAALSAKVIFPKTGQLNCDILSLSLYDGVLTGQAGINLNVPGLAYNGKLKLTGFNTAPFSNMLVETFLTRLDNYKDLLNKVSGVLDASAQFAGRGVEVPAIMANLDAAGSLVIKNGQLKRLKMVDVLADKINAPALKRDINITELASNFTMKNQVINVQSLGLKSSNIILSFRGGTDLGQQKFVAGNRLTLKGSPALTQGLSKEYALLRDDKGWLEATFELTGDFKRPLPALVLEKPLERAVNRLKITIDAKKVEFESASEAEKARLVEEAKKKLQEEARKLLKP
jgi:uncharacterized protein involved in outer membrane biogenesis